MPCQSKEKVAAEAPASRESPEQTGLHVSTGKTVPLSVFPRPVLLVMLICHVLILYPFFFF